VTGRQFAPVISLSAVGLLLWLCLAAGQSPPVTRTAHIVETKPDLPMTLVYPIFLRTWGMQRATQNHARLLLGRRARFDDPQGIAVTVLDARDDPDDERDDDEITVYGVNSGRGEIIYNTGLSTLATYGRSGDGIGEFHDPHGIDRRASWSWLIRETIG